MQLQEWISAHIPDDKMLWKGAFTRQVCFMRDDLSFALGMSYHDTETDKLSVISTHTSKSIKLPVVRYALNDAWIIIRDNFYNHKISVESDKAIRLDPRGLFDPAEQHPRCYCEGFPDELVFGAYADDQKRFTVSVNSDYAAWALFRAVRLALQDG